MTHSNVARLVRALKVGKERHGILLPVKSSKKLALPEGSPGISFFLKKDMPGEPAHAHTLSSLASSLLFFLSFLGGETRISLQTPDLKTIKDRLPSCYGGGCATDLEVCHCNTLQRTATH